MRYKKGSVVEVLSKDEGPSCSWRSAEIICGNGHNYTVRYSMYSGVNNEAVVDRVNRKSIRPFPPSKTLSKNWITGDVVEVFDNLSWKMATVLKFLGRDFFLVKLVGSSLELRVRKSDLRVRQYWVNGKWIMIGKGSRDFAEEEHNKRSSMKYKHDSCFQHKQIDGKMNLKKEVDGVAAEQNIDIQESRLVCPGSLKRASSYHYSHLEAHEGHTLKFRVIQKEGRCHRMVASNPSRSPEKVEVASIRVAPFNYKATGFAQIDVEEKEKNVGFDCSRAINLGCKVDDTDTCSVGSCSVASNNPFRSKSHFSTNHVEDTDRNDSDAESVCGVGYEELKNCLFPTRKHLAEEIHKLELSAYRSTMVALHASGPLSWEQETMVTNLRISLHISNDEHLMELRKLNSAVTTIPIC